MDGKFMNDANRVLDDLEKQVASEPAQHSPEDAHAETILGNVKESATKGVQAVSDKAVELSQEAREKLNEKVTAGREVLTSTLEDTSRVVRQVTEGDSPLTVSLKPYTERVGSALDEASNYLNSVTPQRLIKDTRRLARNNPAVFVGGALVLGLVAARFLKSSSSAEMEA
jgi:hypothetical protein